MEKLVWIGIKATRKERDKLNSLKEIFQRRSNSDMLRFLINNGEKILPETTLAKGQSAD